jgi:cadherin 23
VTEATLEVVIDDVNDNDPIFDASEYRGSVLENSPVGTAVLKVNADDADKNKTVRYSVRANDEVKKLVRVSPTSGEITVGGSAAGQEKIDREAVTREY